MYIYIYKIPWTYTYKYIQMKKSVAYTTYITTKITTTMQLNRLYGVLYPRWYICIPHISKPPYNANK